MSRDGYPKNFSPSEFKCKCCGALPDPAGTRHLAWCLQQIRNLCNGSIKINSGYRCPKHNKAVGGSRTSMHLKGLAADIACTKVSPDMMANIVEELMKDGRIPDGGIGRYNSFTHVDIRPNGPARWDERKK